MASAASATAIALSPSPLSPDAASAKAFSLAIFSSSFFCLLSAAAAAALSFLAISSNSCLRRATSLRARNTCSHASPSNSPSSLPSLNRVWAHLTCLYSISRPVPRSEKFSSALTNALLATSFPHSPAVQIANWKPFRHTSTASAAFFEASSNSSSEAMAARAFPTVPLALSIHVENTARAGPHATSYMGVTYSSLRPVSSVRTNFTD
mmetsp:Transcript_61887/g.182803  ORF Transcript_61887/g.182803 Transcript_61887/m.182803 type:complete len:208 (-) Transcript_61887:4065-4688(-)